MSVAQFPNAPDVMGPVLPAQLVSARRFAMVAPYLPAPFDSGGRIRMGALARALTAVGEVDLFARVYPVELDGAQAPRDRALSTWQRVALFGRGIPTGVPLRDPWRARDAVPIALRDALARAHRARPYDAVIACHAYSFGALARLDDTVRVLDEHNHESRYAREVLRANPLERKGMERFERHAWAASDLVTCVREDDRRTIAAYCAGETAVVPNGVDLSAVPWRPPLARGGRTVLFVGALSHRPNVEACVTLARDVLPMLLREEPEARLVLCGRAPDETVRALASERVTVTGTVPSTAPWLDEASVFANAIREGEGTSLKVIEAAAAGVPIVSTAIGARGFAFTHRTHMLRAEDPGAFAAAILATWRDPLAADRRAHAAREVARTHDWAELGAHFAALVMARVEARRGRA